MKFFTIIFFITSFITAAEANQKGKAYFAGGCFWCMEEVYEKLSGVFLKLPTSAQNAISANEITNLDVIGSTIYIQTSANTFTEKYNYDGDKFTVARPSVSLLDRYDIDFYN